MDSQFTYFALPEELRPDVTFVVRPDERNEMSSKYPRATVVQLPSSVQNLPATRQWIWENFSGERFVMADDDISYFQHRTWDGTRFHRIPLINHHELLRRLEAYLDAGAGMVSPSPTYVPPDVTRWPARPAGLCVQFTMFDGPRLRPLGLRWDRVKGPVEDFDFLMQVLSHGIDCVQVQDLAFSVPTMGHEGGGYNTEDQGDRGHRNQAGYDELRALWPDHVRTSLRDPTKITLQRATLLEQARKRMEDPDLDENDLVHRPEHVDDKLRRTALPEVTLPPRRKRGRPVGSGKPPEERRTEKLVLSLTKEELKRVLIAAASHPEGPQRVTEWARDLLLGAING